MNISKNSALVAAFIAVIVVAFLLNQNQPPIESSGAKAPEYRKAAIPDKSARLPANTPAPLVDVAPPTVQALGGAIECAKFVGQLRSSLPPERHTTREMLSALQATLFINDFVMAAKAGNDDAISLSKAALVDSFTNAAADASFLMGNLSSYSSFPETLTEHYSRVRDNREVTDQIAAIEKVLGECDVVFDPRSDLLLDCVRLVCFRTEVEKIYGPDNSPTSQAVRNPDEAEACRTSFDSVFNFRFTNRFKLEAAASGKLIEKLSKLNLAGVSPADMEIPVVLR